MKRRALLGTLAGAATLGIIPRRAVADSASKASAGLLTSTQYLDRAALFLDENHRAQDWVGAHPEDPALAAVALEISQARSEVAARLGVPAALKQPHLHLLLVLENTIASFQATVAGDAKKAAQRMSNARNEEATMNLAFDAAKVKVPTIK